MTRRLNLFRRVPLCFAMFLVAEISHAQVQIGPPPPPPTFFQEMKLQNDEFGGAAVAISSDSTTAVVGGLRGKVFVLIKGNGTFTQIAQLTDGATATDSFGTSVAISSDGGTIVVGARSADAPAIPGCTIGGGAAYVFVRPLGGWVTTSTYAAKLTNSDGVEQDGLGTSVAVSGDGSIIVVGAPKHRGSNGGFTFGCDGSPLPNSPGSAYVYLDPSAGWGNVPHRFENAEITSSDGDDDDAFGTSVAISGDGTNITVGAPFRNNRQGEAYVFAEPNTAEGWAANLHPTETSQLFAIDGAAQDQFGSSVASSRDGGTVVVGAPEKNVFQGSAYVFAEPPKGWISMFQPQTAGEFGSARGAACDQFGAAVTTSGDGNTIVVGAPFERSTPPTIPGDCASSAGGLGAVYVFTKGSSGWSLFLSPPATKLSGDLIDAGFGAHLATSGLIETIVVSEELTVNNLNLVPEVFIFGQGPLAALSPSTLSFGSQAVGTTGSSQKITLTNNGSEPMSITVEGIDPGFEFQGGTPACLGVSPLAPGASCDEYINFAPIKTGPITGTLSFQDNSGNVPGTQQTVNLSGISIQAATTTTLTFVSPSPAVVGQTVTVGFEVSPSQANPLNPSGNVTVLASTGEKCVGMAVVDNCTLMFTTYGSRTITATYAGDINFTGSTSTSVMLNVGDFSISAVPTTITIPVGGSGSTQVTINSLGGFNSALSLAVAGAPSGVSSSVSPSPVTPPSDGSTSPSTLTVTAGPSVTPTMFSLSSSGTYGSLTHSLPINVAIVATPGSTTNVVKQLLTATCINNTGVANAFTNKLAAAQSAINAGSTQIAVNILDALLYQVQAQSGKHLSTSCTIGGVSFNSAAALIGDVESMLAGLKLLPNPIIGYVANSSGTAVSGAKITIFNNMSTAIASTTSDVTGFYFFSNTAGLVMGSTYTTKTTSFPPPYKTSTPASQKFTWQGALVVLSNFLLTQ